MNACYIGLGYIGLPSAVIAAENGINVHGTDSDIRLVEKIRKAISPHREPGLHERLSAVITAGRMSVSTEIARSDVYIVMVPSPLTDKYEADTSFIKAATRHIIPFLKEGDLFIIESTSPPGTTQAMYELVCRERPELDGKIRIAYCPERTLPGKAMEELVNNDRVIGGMDAASGEAAAAFYRRFVRGQIHLTDPLTAELCKLAENAYRDVQIAFANELSLICYKNGIDPHHLISIANSHPRADILEPRCGVGGHCIAVDPYFLISAYPGECRLMKAARETNTRKREWCATRIHECIAAYEKELHHSPIIALMGLAFKPDTDDMRESPSRHIVSGILQDFGDMEILVSDPNIKEHNTFKLTDYQKAYQEADIVVFLTAHKEFKALAPKPDKIILDLCGVRACNSPADAAVHATHTES